MKNGDKEFVCRSGKAISVFRTRLADILTRAAEERRVQREEAAAA
ncbi:hypothetical protein [Streptomyces sp. NPDC003710]